jgi:hypothetical protein
MDVAARNVVAGVHGAAIACSAVGAPRLFTSRWSLNAVNGGALVAAAPLAIAAR